MADTLEELAYEQACDALRRQENHLDSLRGRATTVVSVAAVVFGLLATRGKADVWVSEALIVVVLIAILTVIVLWPRSFTFKYRVQDLVLEADIAKASGLDQDVRGVRRDWALHLNTYYAENQLKIDLMLDLYTVTLAMLGAEVLLLGVHLV